MMNANRPGDRSTRDKLASLLSYIEQVVRLDERVAFALSDYRLADGRAVQITLADTGALPGVRHDVAGEDGAVWLAVERLKRGEPPLPPVDLAPWITPSPDPARPPEARQERHVEVDAAERLARIAAGACSTSFAAIETPAVEGAMPPPPRYDQTLRLPEQPSTEARILRWIAEDWAPWAAAEVPRRRTIALYEKLYRLLQLRETGGAEAPIEIVWGIGVARWRRGGRALERPLIERAVDLDIDAAAGGVLRVRPTVADASVDLKPYDEMGCPNLGLLDAAIRRDIEAAAAEDGVSPFHRTSFEPILVTAAARLDPDGAYVPRSDGGAAEAGSGETLTIDDAWVLFARPRSAHVLLADITRLRERTQDPDHPVTGLAARLVTEPSTVETGTWTPLSDTLGASAALPDHDEPATLATDVFFPKPFNDDQVEIVRRLARADGLVVQGPPGTGKTHTIANLICHAMATGQRVLVVSRGEAALAVLRDQLPAKVRPLAIALLSNERQGLGQVEGAIREIQAEVEASRPDIRHAAIRRCEAEIVAVRGRLAAVDAALDALGETQAARIGPRAETPAELARRIVAERPAMAWFTDRPDAYLAETTLTEPAITALRAARRAVGDLLDHRDAVLPAAADLPDTAALGDWHAMLLRSAALKAASGEASWHGLRLPAAEAEAAERLAGTLDQLGGLHEGPAADAWLRPFFGSDDDGRWGTVVAALVADWIALDAARADGVRHAVDLPPRLIDDREARAAVARGARGERLWPLLSIGRTGPKTHLAELRVAGAPVGEGDPTTWAAVAAQLDVADRMRELTARWRRFGLEAGAPEPDDLRSLATLATASQLTATARAVLERLPSLEHRLPPLATMTAHPATARAQAAALRQAAEAARLDVARDSVARIRHLFEDGADRTSAMARLFLDEALGRADAEPARIVATWTGLRGLIERVHALAEAFATVTAVTTVIASSGAPAWAARLAREPAGADADALLPTSWREVWDIAAADAHLDRLDARAALTSLARQRGEHERAIARLFLELVRERTYYMLERRLPPGVKAALVEFVRALGRLGKGTGRGAAGQRRVARDAMRRCYAAVPCWIMPTWRVSEQLPPDLGAFDLVILDEASQSDVTELPAVLRGKKILVVGDDRQVSPMTPFVTQAKLDHLRARHLHGLPFQSLLQPGESLYTLMQAVLPDERLMLKEHFRCVEPIIRFSMPFYPETLIPLRVPSAAERLDPPLIDIFVPHGTRDKIRKINRAEADVIVEEIAALVATPGMERRSIGVISLIGGDQAEHIRGLLAERLGAEAMQRHAILCGDSATFQGNERDIVFLSMVADRHRRTALTMQRYEQRFNVAMSRGRDRVVLVRSVEAKDLNPVDLKARLIAHFAQPMPALAAPGDDALERCESDFEHDVMGRLLAKNYAVTPQVGALGFRIDMVVEGDGGRRLAVECDGDRFHGPGQWRDDMRRQRVLERVGWHFWRCFASSFYADPDGVMRELEDVLAGYGIEPRPDGAAAPGPSPFVAHRVASVAPEETEAASGIPLTAAAPTAANVGDRITLSFADDRKTTSILLIDGAEDQAQGLVSSSSLLGQALLGREEDDEVELPINAVMRRAVIERVDRSGRTSL